MFFFIFLGCLCLLFLKFKIIYVFFGDMLIYLGDILIVIYFMVRGFVEIMKDDFVMVILGIWILYWVIFE